jgi:hypothetical protein
MTGQDLQNGDLQGHWYSPQLPNHSSTSNAIGAAGALSRKHFSFAQHATLRCTAIAVACRIRSIVFAMARGPTASLACDRNPRILPHSAALDRAWLQQFSFWRFACGVRPIDSVFDHFLGVGGMIQTAGGAVTGIDSQAARDVRWSA